MSESASESEEESKGDEEEEEVSTIAATSEKKASRLESEGIAVYLRIRPTKKPSKYYDVVDGKLMQWDIPPEAVKDSEWVNNTRTQFKFTFDHVLPMDISQEQVFERVGKKVVLNALDGFNSTVFAYGQTGSGKTYTITGGAERYEDRGIIPRALSTIFNEFRKRSGTQWTAHVSYMEIYNEQGFDLLDPGHDTKTLTELPRVKMMEDERGNFHLKNLSMHRASNEEEALNLLFLGDTNRAISETAMNQASSRSHCIFTVFLEGRKVGSDKVVRAKLNMVDLAGSERVHKTKSDGQTLREAQYINTSLFFLEMVIVALNEKNKGRAHIPYRNSMMTTVLRDSLGGNCKTVMIATVSADSEQTGESISTCRFAQRVALVKNEAFVNEETDPFATIARLKSEVATLKAEVGFLKGEAGEGDALTNDEKASVHSAVDLFVNALDPQEGLHLAPMSLVRIREAFAALKGLVLDARSGSSSSSSSSSGKIGCAAAANGAGGGGGSSSSDVTQLEKTLKERDSEIAILVNMVRQAKAAGFVVPRGSAQASSSSSKQQQQSEAKAEVRSEPKVREVGGVSCGNVPAECVDDPRRAYEYFRTSCSSNRAMEDNKSLLKDKYAAAKALGERVNQSRSTIAYLKTSIEQLRRERALDGLHDNQIENAQPGPEETKKKQAIEHEKANYKEAFDQLRALKTEIETIQKMLDVGRSRIQADFDVWYDAVLKLASSSQGAKHSPRTAWDHNSTPNQRPPSANKAPPKNSADSDIAAFYRAKEELASLHAKR